MQDDNSNIFIELVEAVEAQGGELLAKTHWPTMHTYKHYETKGQHGQQKSEEVEGTGCGLEALLKIPYDSYVVAKTGHEIGDAKKADITVCAVDDAVHLWPRFQEQLQS